MPHFLRDLYAPAEEAARRPVTQAIGVGADGEFRTAVHKEYPRRLSAGFAQAVSSQLLWNLRAKHVRTPGSMPLPLSHGYMKLLMTVQLSERQQVGFRTIKDKVEAFGFNSFHVQ